MIQYKRRIDFIASKFGNALPKWGAGVILLALVSLDIVSADSPESGIRDAFNAIPRLAIVPNLQVRTRRVEPQTFEYCDLKFEVGADGAVKKLEMDYPPADSLKFGVYRDSLKTARFSFAEGFKPKPKATVHARLLIQRLDSRGPRLLVPVDSMGSILDFTSALRTIKANGFKPPELMTFPSYYFSASQIRQFSKTPEPIAVVRIGLDVQGKVIDRTLLFQTDSALGEMILLASGYADFKPASAGGKKVSSAGYLIVRFFTELSYPTQQWNYDSALSIDPTLERDRVVWIPEIDSFSLPPVRAQTQPRKLNIATKFGPPIKRSLTIQVNSMGEAELNSVSGQISKELSVDLNSRVGGMRFYPGLSLIISPGTDSLRLRYEYALGTLELEPQVDSSYLVKTAFPIRVPSR